MTREAEMALVAIGTNRQGATPPSSTSKQVMDELKDNNMIGKGNGLTRYGSIARERIASALMDAAF